jgi:Tfp pilus assembly PilM family ATPase
MQSAGGGVTSVPQQDAFTKALANVPDNFSENDIERVVQTITDQIMATA